MTACVAALVCVLPAADAQSAAGTPQSNAAPTQATAQHTELPNAPAPNAQTPDAAVNAAQTTGTISGTVTDTQGALVSGAQVTLTGNVVEAPRTTVSRPDGTYFFEKVHAGTFHLKAVAVGMNEGEITGTIAAGGVYLAPPIQLGSATSATELTVSPLTEKQLATQQVKQEEKQKVLGFVPNYYVTYDKTAVPLDAKQKFGLGFHELLDPTTVLFAAGVAGLEQSLGAFSGYGTGPAGFGRRFGAALGDTTSSVMLRDAVFPAILHEDPRYYYMGTGTTMHRAIYALKTAVICKDDNGNWGTNYAGILGSLSSGALANLYYAPSDRHGATLTIENGLLSVAGVGLEHLLQEFVLRHYTSHVPAGTPGP